MVLLSHHTQINITTMSAACDYQPTKWTFNKLEYQDNTSYLCYYTGDGYANPIAMSTVITPAVVEKTVSFDVLAQRLTRYC